MQVIRNGELIEVEKPKYGDCHPTREGWRWVGTCWVSPGAYARWDAERLARNVRRIFVIDPATGKRKYAGLRPKDAPAVEIVAVPNYVHVGGQVAVSALRKTERGPLPPSKVRLTHNKILAELARRLANVYGKEAVSVEQPLLDGRRIDLALEFCGERWFYEVKVGASALDCVRQAVGQLLEYAFFSGVYVDRLVVVGNHPSSEAVENHLLYLREQNKIPLYYMEA